MSDCVPVKRSAIDRQVASGLQDFAQLQEENVFLFVPNLIGELSAGVRYYSLIPRSHLFLPGYTRVILAALSLHYMSTHPKYCTTLYAVSCLLDAVDGKTARALGQTSKFGAVLDMVTDRLVRGSHRNS